MDYEFKDNATKIALKKKAESYYMQNKLEESLKTYEQLISYYKPNEELLRQFDLLKIIGGIYGLLKNPQQTIEIYIKALKIFNSLEEDIQEQALEEKLLLLYDLAAVYSKLKQHPKALLIYKNLLNLHTEYGPLVGIADDLFEIANIYYKQEDYYKALENYYESLKLYDDLKHQGQQGIIHYHIGEILHLKENFTEAFPHLDKALMIFTKINLEMPFEVIEENEYYRKAKTLWEHIKRRMI